MLHCTNPMRRGRHITIAVACIQPDTGQIRAGLSSLRSISERTKSGLEYSSGFCHDDVRQPARRMKGIDGFSHQSFDANPRATDSPRTSNLAVCKPTHSQHHGTRLALIIDDDDVASLVVAQAIEPIGYKVKCPYDIYGCTCQIMPISLVRKRGHFTRQRDS